MRAGLTRSCGCLHSETMAARGNHYPPGTKFGRLTVVKELSGKHRRYFCRCRCGEYVSVRGRCLAEGSTRSCGCLYRATRKSANLRHGKSPQGKKIAVYSCWTRQRGWCFNPKDHHWKYYGGKGVQFLFKTFPEFYLHVGDQPPGCWLMRKDRDGNFEAGNLHWVERRSRAKKKSPARIGRASNTTPGSIDTASPAIFRTPPRDQPSCPCQI